MTSEEAIRNIDCARSYLSMSGVVDEPVYKALEMAIKALEVVGRVETIRSRRTVSNSLLQSFPDAVSVVKDEIAKEIFSYMCHNGYVRIDQFPIPIENAEEFTAEIKVVIPRCRDTLTSMSLSKITM